MYRFNRFALLCFMVLVLMACAWTALHLRVGFEWREQPLIQISDAQQTRLQSIHTPIELTAYINGNPRLRQAVVNQLQQLKNLLPTFHYRIQNPDTDPIGVQKHNITQNGQLYLQMGNHGKRIDVPVAEVILRTVLMLDDTARHQAVHLQDSGERGFLADTGGSWRGLYQALNNPLLDVTALGLTQSINIPENADLAIIADPSPYQHAIHLNASIQTYLNQGGNVIYTTDTQHPYLPPILAQMSGLQILPGVVVDMVGRTIGFSDPRIIPVAVNENTDLGRHSKDLPVLSGAVAFTQITSPAQGWTLTPLFKSSRGSWNETSEITGRIALDVPQEQQGPLVLAWLLTRSYHGNQQSVLILGDSDLFAGNALALGGNRQFGTLAIAMLSHSLSGQVPVQMPLADQYIQQSVARNYLLATILLLIFPLMGVVLLILMRRHVYRHYQKIVRASQCLSPSNHGE